MSELEQLRQQVTAITAHLGLDAEEKARDVAEFDREQAVAADA